MRKLILLCIIGLGAAIITPTESIAAPQEKGANKCSDGIDNDGDTLIDGADPDCGEGDDPEPDCPIGALFPALIYPVDSAAGDGTRDLTVASGDGCVELTVEQGVHLGGVRLKYDDNSEHGHYAWSENTRTSNPTAIKRQEFTATADSITPTTFEVLYEGIGRLGSFAIRGSLLAVTDLLSMSGERVLLIIDLSTCDSGLPCNGGDGVAVYTPTMDCLQDSAIMGCFDFGGGLTMSLDGSEVYFNVQGENSNGGRVNGIARVTRGQQGWAAQTPELFLRDDNYHELRVYELSQNSRFLAFGYLAGFLQSGPRDDRVIIIDTQEVGPNCPCEATGLSRDFSAWTATWTVDDTFYVLGTEGRRRKLKHPIEEFDPTTGQRTPLGISLSDHPGIDSSL